MSDIVSLEHTTEYTFSTPVVLGPHLVRLRPLPHTQPKITDYSLSIDPLPVSLHWQQDALGNFQARALFDRKTSHLKITVGFNAELTPVNPFDFLLEPYAETFPFTYPTEIAASLSPYLTPIASTHLDSSSDPLRLLHDAAPTTLNWLEQLNAGLAREIAYTTRYEPGVQSPDATLDAKTGSCRDTSWLLVTLLRKHGLAARFVSGYLVQLDQQAPSPETAPSDTLDLHAWAEVFLPGAGWVGLDPTSGMFTGENHIPLAAAAHPSAAAAIEGTHESADSTIEFTHSVARLTHSTPLSQPYPADVWERIDALGNQVDSALEALDVRLTMGGEPTFISKENPEAAEWTFAADGVDKRHKAAALAELLKSDYASNGLLHHGAGKWYPGENAPRWNIALYWRKDGQILYPHPETLDTPESSYHYHDSASASAAGESLLKEIAAELGIAARFCLPGYEDPLTLLSHEFALPPGEQPTSPLTTIPLGTTERAAFVAKLTKNIAEPQCWVLPLHRTEDGSSWATALWEFRRERLFLLPGQLAAAERLPSNSLNWSLPGFRPQPTVSDSKGKPLPEFNPSDTPQDVLPQEKSASTLVTPLDKAPTTALVVEHREGKLYVFLPPLESTESFILLLQAVGKAANRLSEKVIIEGYRLPPDPRLETLSLAPDPGVLEINVHPARSWQESVDIYRNVHERAAEVALTAERFDSSGRHQGTGGGSHITLGGATLQESPFLRNHDLLASMLTYWQHHPSLSYLFSGKYVGATSQAPRYDESHPDELSELELALELLRHAPKENAPWAVDTALRYWLTDRTGNAHRSEFCIDKLYNHDLDIGRLGLLELRSFEMLPHYRLQSVIALLVRTLVARLWEKPYSGPLHRWGPSLHDKFLLPAYAWQDFCVVLDDLESHGYQLEKSWFQELFELRFPLISKVHLGETILEFRHALEPWDVIGDQNSSNGTARTVDASTERLQISLIEGTLPADHVLVCNGHKLPLHEIPGSGQVAGVRFKSHKAHPAFHPGVPVQLPLTFDVVDIRNERYVAGVTYQGGFTVNGQDTPVNAAAAESRRASLLNETHRHTGDVPPETISALREHVTENYTLDLRWPPQV